MTITLPELLLMVLIAAVVGAVGSAIAGSRHGFFVSMVLGFIGTMVGPWIAHALRLSEPLVIRIDGHAFGILWPIVGAAVFVALIHLISGPRYRFRRWA